MAKSKEKIIKSDICPVAAVTVDTDRALGRAGNRSRRYLKVSLQAVVAEERKQRPPLHIALVIDRSGSMGGPKMALAQQAVNAVLANLQSTDYFAVIAFDDRIEVVTALSPATGPNVRAACQAVQAIDARGSTAIADGYLSGVQQLLRAADLGDDALRRVVLVTDGQANIGPRSPAELSAIVGPARGQSISTSCLGIGDDFNEELLAAMAVAGGGQFYFVSDPSLLPRILLAELGEALSVVARGIAVDLCPSPGVRLEVLSNYPAQWTGTQLHLEVGDLVSDQELDLLIAALLPAGQHGETPSVEVTVSDREGPLELPVFTAHWRLTDSASNDTQPRDLHVLEPVAVALAGAATLAAVRANREGDFLHARATLDELLVTLGHLAPGSSAVEAVRQKIVQLREELSQQTTERSRKEHHMMGSSLLRDKDEQGLSRRSRPR